MSRLRVLAFTSLLALAPSCLPPSSNMGADGSIDAGASDAGLRWCGTSDCDGGSADSGFPDAGGFDAGLPDAATGDAGPDAGAGDGGSTDAGAHDAGGADAGLWCPAPANLGRGPAWVRTHPMFISAMTVSMPAPPAAVVNDYFDAFHATAAHFWAAGLPDEVASWSDAGRPDFRYVSWVNELGASYHNGALLGGVPALPGRIGYQIYDEPRDLAMLQTIEATAVALRAADPDALLILNFSPVTDATTQALLSTAQGDPTFDVFSYDQYDYGDGPYQSLSRVRAAALASGRAYWRWMDAYRSPAATDTGTQADFRWDALVGTVYGFTGYSWFIYDIDPTNPDLRTLLFDATGDWASPHTQVWQWVAELNLELANLGRTLVLLRSTEVCALSPLSFLQPAATTAWARGAGGDPYLDGVSQEAGAWSGALLGFFRDDCDQPYVMVQNSARPSASFPNGSASDRTFSLTFDFSSTTDASLSQTSVWVLDPAQATVGTQALTPLGNGRAQLQLTIPAGGVRLFKYRNAFPFARQ